MANTVARNGVDLTIRTPIGIETQYRLITLDTPTWCMKDDAEIPAGQPFWTSYFRDADDCGQRGRNPMCQACAGKVWGVAA